MLNQVDQAPETSVYNRRSSGPTLVAFAPSRGKRSKVASEIKHFAGVLSPKFKLSQNHQFSLLLS